MKRVIALLLVCMLLLSACGTDTEPTTAPTDSTGTTDGTANTDPTGAPTTPTEPLPPLPEKLLEYKSYTPEGYIAPINQGTVVYNESAMIVLNEDGSYPDLSLLYPIEQVISVRNSTLDVEYEQGKDYEVVDGKLRILPGSTMPMLRYDQMYLPNRVVNQSWPSSDGGYLYYSEGVVFQRLQISVTYTHAESATYEGFWQGYKGALLPNTAQKLAAKEPMNITFIGDSITYGLNTSGIVNTAPFAPSWGAMVVDALNTVYGQNITFTNLALGGTTAAWGEGQMGSVTQSDPDLLVIAFGMNDGAGSVSAAGFATSLKNMISKMKAANPECEILLVSTTLPNPDIPEAYKTQKDYEEAMMALEEQGVAVMQMTSVHKGLLEKKNFYDISGSNLNHPNDFLTRMYAQSCIAALIENPVTPEPTGEENKKEPASVSTAIPSRPANDGKTALLQVLVNEARWVEVDLTSYLGQDNTWVEVPLQIDWLREGVNQFALNSNAFNRGNMTSQSLDILATNGEPGVADSFISTNDMVYWNVMHNRRLNIRLELFDGEKWVALDEGAQYDTSGGTVVIGKFTPDGYTYISGRNLEAPELTGYTKARLMVNAHVGTSLLENPANEEPDEVDPGNPLDTTVPLLKVQLNGAIAERVELAPYYGQNSVWVTVPLRFEKLRVGTNYVALDSNVNNPDNLTNQTVDLYFTTTADAGGGELTQDGGTTWIQYGDRIPNMYLELHNAKTGQWERIGYFEFSDQQEHTVIGMFTNPWLTAPFAFRRAFTIKSLEGYDDVRVCMQIHVGSNLELK